MMSVVELGPVVKTLEIRRRAEDAFRVFITEISKWWPIKQHSRARDADGEYTVRVDFEAQVGGRIYETLNTGETRDWGEVLEIEDGHRLLFSFQMGRAKEKSGEVEVRFEPLASGNCRVVLTHSNWERLGDEAESMRNNYSRGWEFVFVDGFGTYAGTI